MLTRSHSASTSARMWLESSTVPPAAAVSATHRWNSASINGSSPDVGSSIRYSSTSLARAATNATFCRLPFEYVRAFFVGSSSNRSSRSARRRSSSPPRSRPSRSMISPPERFGHRSTSPGTYARRRCRETASRHGSPPRTTASPESARSIPSRTRIVVDFPDPLGPRNPCTSPVATSRSSPSSARVLPNVLTRLRTEMAALTRRTVDRSGGNSSEAPQGLRGLGVQVAGIGAAWVRRSPSWPGPGPWAWPWGPRARERRRPCSSG